MTLKAIALLLALLAAAPDDVPPPPTAVLTIDATDLRNTRGTLRVGVFDRAAGFPRSREGAMLWRSIPADAEEAVLRVDLPPGEYAAVVLHDENSNKQLDRNFLGVPKEGYGTTNNAKPALRAATFKEARFRLPPEGARLSVSIQYF